jgi:hypothetical protein
MLVLLHSAYVVHVTILAPAAAVPRSGLQGIAPPC